MATVSERIKKIIINQLGVAEEVVVPAANFIKDLNADSLDLVELTMAMEEEFSTPTHKISISDDDADKIKTVQDAVDYIEDIYVPETPAVPTPATKPAETKTVNTKPANSRPYTPQSFSNNRNNFNNKPLNK